MTTLLYISAFACAALGFTAAATLKDGWAAFNRDARAVGIAVSTVLFGAAAISIAAAL